ncbi:mammalian cell entry protein, partial [Thalassospira xiamenensis]
AFYEDAPAQTTAALNDIPVMPSISSGFAQLEQKVSTLLDNLNKVPMVSIGEKFDQTLSDSSAMLQQLTATSERLEALLANADTQGIPKSLNDTLQQLQQTLQNFDSQAPAYRNLEDSLEQLNEVLRDLRPLAETLNEQPNSLIFDREPVRDPQPKSKN